MSGQGGSLSGFPQASSGTPASMPTAVDATNMPTWMRGLAGAATGNPTFGQNAPLINQGLQMAMGGQRQPMAPAPMAPRQPMGAIPQMGGGMAPPVQGSPFGLMR